MKILVTGGAGYIGSVTAEKLIESGHEIFILDNLSEGHIGAIPPGSRFIEADILNTKELRQIFSTNKFDAVVHFAANCYVDESVENPGKYYKNNVFGSINILEEAVKSSVEKFVFSSTCSTYGIPEKIPIVEEEKQKPINPYGETKLAFEKTLKWYGQTYQIKYTILRYFNAAGATEKLGEDHRPETHLIPLVLQCALGKRSEIKIFGTDYNTKDGTCIRDYIHVSDIAKAHMLALENNTSDAFNLGNGTGYSVKEVIETAKAVTGKKINTTDCPRRKGDPPVLVGSAEKIHKKLGWEPQFPSLKEIISTAWQWHKRFPEGYGK